MIKSFRYCTFSIFCIEDLNLVLNAVKLLYKNELSKNKAVIEIGEVDIKDYLNPISGGRHLEKFCCWKNEIYQDKVFFISNYEDGLVNLCGLIQAQLKCKLIMCALSNEMEYPKYLFRVLNPDDKERLILAYKEDKWTFFEKGTCLPFEDSELYKKRLIRERLNNKIIYFYLNENGVDFHQLDENIIASFTFIRKEW